MVGYLIKYRHGNKIYLGVVVDKIIKDNMNSTEESRYILEPTEYKIDEDSEVWSKLPDKSELQIIQPKKIICILSRNPKV